MAKIRLSPTVGLGLFLQCPRCFWLHVNKNIKRPRGIFPSLPSGMDTIIKKYFDSFRLRGELPPEIRGEVKGKLFDDINLLRKWRAWNSTDLCYTDESSDASLSGALDDCLLDNGYYIPLDYKTKGSKVKEDPAKYYQIQLDSYCLMLDESGYKTKGLAYLVYFYPTEVKEAGEVHFEVNTFEIKTNPENAKRIFREAVKLLKGPLPKAGLECEYCGWLESAEKYLERRLF